MKIAVIGGSGFIGSRLIEELKNLQIGDVTNIDIKENPSCRNLICDILDSKQLNCLLSGFDYVYLLSAISEASRNTSDPVNSMNLNIMGTVNVLDACVQHKIKRIIFASTAWVYDLCIESNVNEDTPLSQTLRSNLYTTSKVCGESLIKSYHQTFGLDYTILRFGTAYGPNCNPRTAIASFVRNAENKQTIKINGNGEGFRSFMYVSDHVKSLVLSLTNDSTKNEIINVDGPDKVTLNNIVEMLKEYYCDLDVEYVSSQLPEYKGKNVDCTKARKLLGFVPSVNFKEGLKNYVQWFKNTNSSTPCR